MRAPKQSTLKYKSYEINGTIDIPICPNCEGHLLFKNPDKFYNKFHMDPDEDIDNIKKWSKFTDHLDGIPRYITDFHCEKCNLHFYHKIRQELIKNALGKEIS